MDKVGYTTDYKHLETWVWNIECQTYTINLS